MPIPTNGLIEITFTQSFGGQTLENVFYYWNILNNEPSSFVALAADFDLKVAQEFAGIQSVNLTYSNIKLKTVFGLLPDLNTTPTLTNGTTAGDDSPSYMSFGIRLGGQTKETRPGQKRISGCVETIVSGNTISPSFLPFVQDVGDAMLLSLDSGTDIYDPVIASRPTVARPNWVVNHIVVATANPLITSQVSRKRRV